MAGRVPLRRAGLMISALALFGCGSGTKLVGPTGPRPTLSMVPYDVTSAVGTTPLQVQVYNYAKAVGEELLAPIGDEVRLVSWPDGTPVAVTTQLQAFTPRRENGVDVAGSGTITVTPGSALEDRWYFLHVVTPPAAVDLAGVMQLHRLADGRAGVRFNPAPNPRMTWVRRCPSDVSAKVVVDFSEIVVLDSNQALTVEASGGACARLPAGSELRGNSFSFGCEGLASSASIRVHVANTVTGVGGHPVQGAGLPADFPPAAFDLDGNCSIAAVGTD